MATPIGIPLPAPAASPLAIAPTLRTGRLKVVWSDGVLVGYIGDRLPTANGWVVTVSSIADAATVTFQPSNASHEVELQVSYVF